MGCFFAFYWACLTLIILSHGYWHELHKGIGCELKLYIVICEFLLGFVWAVFDFCTAQSLKTFGVLNIATRAQSPHGLSCQ